nr:unnamed protein product [Spirometra erinaceieuropaei]
MIHRVEGFCQIHVGRVQVDPHLLALLLKFWGGDDHVGGLTTMAEAELAFWQEFLSQMVVERVDEDAGDLSDDIEEGDVSVVVAD